MHRARHPWSRLRPHPEADRQCRPRHPGQGRRLTRSPYNTKVKLNAGNAFKSFTSCCWEPDELEMLTANMTQSYVDNTMESIEVRAASLNISCVLSTIRYS